MNLFRQQIDDLDNQILHLLAKRADLVKEIGQTKRDQNLPIVDPEREAELMQRLKEKAEDQGLSSEFVEKLYQQVLAESHRIQELES